MVHVTLTFKGSIRILQTCKNRSGGCEDKISAIGEQPTQHLQREVMLHYAACVLWRSLWREDKEDPFIYSTEFLLGFPKLFWKCSAQKKKSSMTKREDTPPGTILIIKQEKESSHTGKKPPIKSKSFSGNNALKHFHKWSRKRGV